MPNIPGVADHGVPPAPFVKRAKKALVALLGVAAMVVSTGVLEENIEIWVNALLGLATAAGVYQAKNRATAAPRDLNARA